MRAQLALRDRKVLDGSRQVGWKLGFGSPAALAHFGLDRPLVGFLLDSGMLADGADADLSGWDRPMLEPEVAVHLARDLAPGSSWDETRRAIRGFSAAIELADLTFEPTDVEQILAGDIFHRHFVLGPIDERLLDAEHFRTRVLIGGDEVAATDTPQDLTGELVEIIRLTVDLLAGFGERLRADEFVLTGSVVPPLPVHPGMTVQTEMQGLGSLRLTLE